MRWRTLSAGTTGLFAAGLVFTLHAQQPPAARRSSASPGPAASATAPHLFLVDEYCVACHDEDKKKGNLALDAIVGDDISKHADIWEKVVRKLRARQMPPVGNKERPDEATYEAAIASLVTSLDRSAAAHPNPGRTATIRRLTRTEYQNAIRDLLALEIDVTSMLPIDESSYGFDNVTVGDLLAYAARSLYLSRGKDQPDRDRPSQPFARRRDDQDARGSYARRSH